ncbi:NAD(P)H-hydrate epimerase [Parvibaculum indicum]|uniref:NAD(P)H-hydrate dehydratase n=1 Tax=Parvibaculum indicum TaxID=562969 RepID=UPI001423674E|nr:NAD(P)H-hydrate dehydratase [Parvibaculum indicum]NIJ42663.1 NAD(P)H-hydrate epimerase [Parvibaculum indicum]
MATSLIPHAPAKTPAALLTVEEMGRADRLTIEGGKPGIVLMENAGRGVAEAAVAHFEKAPVSVLCGPGNNGGDGFIAARLLRDWGWQVTVFLMGARESLKGDAAEAAHRWAGPVYPLTADAAKSASLVIDAIFGAGLSRDVEGTPADIVRHVTEEGIPVLAVDVPSGIDGDTGLVRGAAFRAAHTVTFFRAKPGHRLLPGRAHCGEVHVVDIGIEDKVLDEIAPRRFDNTPGLWWPAYPRPSIALHKYDHGHAVVLSGDAAHTGAARLAARGALRAGSGLVTVATPPDALAVNAAHLTAIMLAPFKGPDGLTAILEDKRKNACLIGPGAGVGSATRECVLAALLSGAAMVLDADALTSFAEIPRDLFVAIRGYFAGPTVLTPHEGEFARIFPDLSTANAGEKGKLVRARLAAEQAGAVIVLKGPDTVIASPDGKLAVNANAGPELATAGSGDVLGGIILGLMAQGMPPFEAAAAGVWLHGEAGHHFGPGLIAEDLPEMLPAVRRELLETLS